MRAVAYSRRVCHDRVAYTERLDETFIVSSFCDHSPDDALKSIRDLEGTQSARCHLCPTFHQLLSLSESDAAVCITQDGDKQAEHHNPASEDEAVEQE